MEIATEHEAEEVISFLCGAIGEEVPDNVKLRQLAKAVYKDDDAEKFKTVLTSLSPELVRLLYKGFFPQSYWIITGEQNSCGQVWKCASTSCL